MDLDNFMISEIILIQKYTIRYHLYVNLKNKTKKCILQNIEKFTKKREKKNKKKQLDVTKRGGE